MPKFKSEHIGFNVSNNFKKKVEEIANEKQMSIAEFVRYILQKYIDEYDNKINNENR